MVCGDNNGWFSYSIEKLFQLCVMEIGRGNPAASVEQDMYIDNWHCKFI
jgi:hypothetical protein